MQLGTLNYRLKVTPPGYRCKCGKTGVKLWRDLSASADAVDLYCADCARQETNVLDVIADDGSRFHPVFMQRTFQIGGLVPAFPTPDGRSFYYYAAARMPQAVFTWWARLPL